MSRMTFFRAFCVSRETYPYRGAEDCGGEEKHAED